MLMPATPGRCRLPAEVKSEPVGVVSLMRWRVNEASTATVGQYAAAEIARCARASSIRSNAARRSRFDGTARSINEPNIASLKPFHQPRSSADCSVASLTGAGADSGCAGPCSVVTLRAIARSDQCAGVCGVGRTKLGPTLQAAVSATSESAPDSFLKMGLRSFMGVTASGY